MTVFKNIVRTIVIVLSCMMIYWYFISEMVNIGSISGVIFFLVTGLAAVFIDQLRSLYKRMKKRLWSRIAADAVIVLFCSFVVWVTVILCCMGGYAARRPVKGATAVVLGCQVNGDSPSLMLYRRLEAACAYLQENPDAVCIVSGGKGGNENISEAECMYRWLTDKGISPSRIYREDRSTNTSENIAFSAEIIKKNGLNSELALITDGFHEMRAIRIAEKNGFSCGSVPADTPFYLLGTFATREVWAVTAELLLP